MTVSVIIPTWNRSSSLKQAIVSALSQTHSPLEVIVCDDGSTDDTEEVVRSIHDPRVVWLPGERSGRPSVPRNRGISVSLGEWLAFLDDDDVWMPEKLKLQLERARMLNCLASCTQACDRKSDIYKLGWDGKQLTFRDMMRGNRVICSSSLIHRSVLFRADGFPESTRLTSIEDYAFWLRVATVTDFAFVGEPLVIYADSSHTSLRSYYADALKQKRLVLGNFLVWGCRKRISADHLKAALNSYCDILLLQVRKRLGTCREQL